MRKQLQTRDRDDAIKTAYLMMKRRIGPGPLSEIAFLTGLFWGDAKTYASGSRGGGGVCSADRGRIAVRRAISTRAREHPYP